MLIEKIKEPNDIKKLSLNEIEILSSEIRDKIIYTATSNGGHLSSNLGVVELTIAIHRVFDSPKDKIIFDVGHQTYTHKLLTGRYDKFSTIRKHKGLSGFPRYSESEHDAFEVGHASTAISAGLGMARARDLQNKDNHVVVVVGDGALTGGMCYEALNDAGCSSTKLIVILNDNDMSISKNVGALSIYLSKLRSSKVYRNTKKNVKYTSLKIPFVGKFIYKFFHFVKNFSKAIFVKNNFFTPLGFNYIGPIDGHDVQRLENVLSQAKEYNEPVLIHCYTKKGKGDIESEDKPDLYHGVSPSNSKQPSTMVSSGKFISNILIEMMKKDDKIVVVTAAMESGTGTSEIKKMFPKRYFDVGIAEEHAVTMCAGMAREGLKPYFFVYSTFLQRCMDQIIHDVYLQNLKVVFCIDRCGIAGEDGITHNGIYDLSMSLGLPFTYVSSPSNTSQLYKSVISSIDNESVTFIRYPKNIFLSDYFIEDNSWDIVKKSDRNYIISYGTIVNDLKEIFKNENIGLIDAYNLSPLDDECLKYLSKNNFNIIVVEEHIVNSGLGASIALYKVLNNLKFELSIIALNDKSIQHGSRDELLRDIGFDPETLKAKILNKLKIYE